MNSWEFYSRIEMFKHSQKDDELAHYGITGQKWGRRRWQNADGTFNAEGKERYFGSKSSSSSDDKMGGARSNVKDYLKFRNKMLKKHAKADMDKWYIEEHKEDDKKLLKDAKRIDKSAKKMYENQLKDYYDNPNDLVDDLNKVYKFGGKNKGNSNNVDEIYKKHKPNEWRSVLNNSDLSTEDKIKIENELNKKLYKEDKHYANIVNNEDVKNALKEYIDVRNDVIKESNRIFSKEFMDSNPEAKDWDGDGTEYWHKFADKDIANKDIESYWKLRETVSSLSRKHGSWNNEIFDKVMSDLTEPVEDITDDSSKAYDKIKEHIGVDFREPNQKFGSSDSNLSPKEEKKAAEEAQKINDAFHGNYEQLSEAIRTLYNDKKFDEVYKNVGNAIKEKYKNEFDEIEKIYGDFDDVEDEYLALAGLNSAIMYNDGKMKDIAYVPYLYLEEDLNQGDLTAEAIWAYDNGINDSWDRWDHMNEIEKNAKNDMINELANNKSYESKVVKNLDDYIKDSIKSHIWNNEVVPHSYWTLYNAGDTTKDEYDSVKDTSLKESRNISNKLQPSCGNDVKGWYYLNQAINNLGMANMSYKDLTDADWKRINDEVNKLKR